MSPRAKWGRQKGSTFANIKRGRVKGLFIGMLLAMAQAVGAQTAADSVRPLGEVVKTGVRTPTDSRHIAQTITQISRAEIEERQSVSLLDIAAEQTPSLFHTARGVLGYGVSTGGSGSLTMRGVGGSPNTEMMVLIDGHPHQMAIMGHPLADAYLSMIAEGVEIVRGPASMLYGGGAMGGVMNIITRQAQEGTKTDVRIAAGSYGTLTSEASNLFRQGKLWSAVGVSFNRTDGHRTNNGFRQWAGYAKVGYDFSTRWKAFADLDITHFKASNPGTESEPMLENDQWITRGVASLNLQNDYGRTAGGATLYLNWGNHKIDDGRSEGEEPTQYYFRSHDHTLGLNLYQGARLWEGSWLTVGVDWQSINGHAWNEPKEREDYDETQLVDTTLWDLAGYLSLRQDLLRRLTAEAGLRVDHHSQAGTELIPQFGLTLRLSNSIDLKATAARGFRNPTLMNLFMFTPANADLEAESLWSYEVGLAGRALKGRLSYGANVYYLRADNLIQTVARKNVNTGEIRNWGIEVEAAWQVDKHWRVATNYSFIHSRNHIVATPKHKWHAELGWHSGAWTLGVSGDWINHLVTQTDEYERSSYVLLNARAACRLNQWIELFARGENLLAQKYEINYGYTMPRATAMGGIHLQL